jgi:hypothetical protein
MSMVITVQVRTLLLHCVFEYMCDLIFCFSLLVLINCVLYVLYCYLCIFCDDISSITRLGFFYQLEVCLGICASVAETVSIVQAWSSPPLKCMKVFTPRTTCTNHAPLENGEI